MFKSLGPTRHDFAKRFSQLALQRVESVLKGITNLRHFLNARLYFRLLFFGQWKLVNRVNQIRYQINGLFHLVNLLQQPNTVLAFAFFRFIHNPNMKQIQRGTPRELSWYREMNLKVSILTRDCSHQSP
ncbi:hypothetical protein Hanom_Chr10g00921741 [Helianthus anomalus]